MRRKDEIPKILINCLELEAKRIGYYPSVLHSDRGTEFVNGQITDFCRTNHIKHRLADPYTPQQNGLAERHNQTILDSLQTIILDSGFSPTLWHKLISLSTLTLNQIPTAKFKKSPYELFKSHSLPLTYFLPIGNPVSFLLQPKSARGKLDPLGLKGCLLGYNPELHSYRILANNGRILDTKHITFLDFERKNSSASSSPSDELFFHIEKPLPATVPESSTEHSIDLKENLLDAPSEMDPVIAITEPASEEDSLPVNLAPPVSKVLRDRTPNIRPTKYSHYSQTSDNHKISDAKLIKLQNIEDHDVWEDFHGTPDRFLNTTWAICEKTATLSTPKKTKARLCIQGFLQTPGIDFNDTFAPTGKFSSLLLLLVFALEKKFSVRQFDVKSAFLYAPLSEDIFIKTPKESHQSSPFLKLKKSLYGL